MNRHPIHTVLCHLGRMMENQSTVAAEFAVAGVPYVPSQLALEATAAAIGSGSPQQPTSPQEPTEAHRSPQEPTAEQLARMILGPQQPRQQPTAEQPTAEQPTAADFSTWATALPSYLWSMGDVQWQQQSS